MYGRSRNGDLKIHIHYQSKKLEMQPTRNPFGGNAPPLGQAPPQNSGYQPAPPSATLGYGQEHQSSSYGYPPQQQSYTNSAPPNDYQQSASAGYPNANDYSNPNAGSYQGGYAQPSQSAYGSQPSQSYAQPPPRLGGASPSSGAPYQSRQVHHSEFMAPPPMAAAGPSIDANLENSLRDSEEFNANARFVRASFARVPANASMKAKIPAPMGFVFQPLAPLPVGHPEVPTVNFSAVGTIVRCRRCRSYMNPFVQWEASGRRWICNLCGFANETLNAYYGPLDATGRRADRYEHAELCSGSVDYIAPAEYMVRPPQPPIFLFLIEATSAAVSMGMFDSVIRTIRSLVAERRFPGDGRTQIGIVTFDSAIHFYNLSAELKQPQMIVVSDFEEVFLPLPDEILVNLHDSEAAILSLLDALPVMLKNNKAGESCLGSAVKAARLVMKDIGGKLIVCASTIPSIGDLGLKSTKDNPRLLNTDREIELLRPSVDGYRELATELTKAQICVELFVATRQYVDLASVAPLVKHTAGDLRYYPHYDAALHERKLRDELIHVCTRPMGWEAVMRVRVSRGWKIANFFGHLSIHGVVLVVPNCHQDQTFSIVLEPEENVSPDPVLCLQFALLYTNSESERRIRVHTMQQCVSHNAAEIYQRMDSEVVASLMAHLALEESLKTKLSDGRNLLHRLTQSIVSSAPGAPTVNTMALYVLGLLKSSLFRSTNDVSADMRVFQWTRFGSLPLVMQTGLCYPRMYALHILPAEVGTQDPATGRTLLPADLPVTAQSMTNDGVFLLEDGECMQMWLGAAVSPDFLYPVFGVSAINQLNLDAAEAAIGSTGQPLGLRVGAILAQLRADRQPPHMQLVVLPSEHPNAARFFQSLIEDGTVGMMVTYPEFLQRLGANAPMGVPPPAANTLMPAPGR